MSIRGLPDERPRPSVANLIGKFEQRASKRQSSVPPGGAASPNASPAPSRPTSIVSHLSGDTAQIEVKERREWPPRNATNDTNSNTASAFSVADLRRSLEKSAADQRALPARNIVASPPPDAPSDAQAASSLSASVLSIAAGTKPQQTSQEPTADPPASSGPPSPLAPEVVKSDPGKKETSPSVAPEKLKTSKSTNSVRSGLTSSKPVTSRNSTAGSKSTPVTPAKGAGPPARPLTTQRTGNFAGSTAAARAGALSPPVIAQRSKTPTAPRSSASTSQIKGSPAIARAKTPIAGRAKTPVATSPPKVSSSGLYKPTKASLAKARDADAPPPPAHEKKLPISALERLMKPTAASASKVRTTPVSPPRAPAAAAKPARVAAPARGKTVKPRVGLAPARMKEEREKKEKEEATKTTGATASVADSGAEVVEHAASGDESVEHEHEHEHGEEDQEHEQGPPSDIESYDDAFASDDDRKIDSAHLLSARPSEEAREESPFPSTPDPPRVVGEVAEVQDLHSEQQAQEDVTHEEIAPLAEGDVVSANANGNGAAEVKQNGVTVDEPSATTMPETEFDNVLDMLQVKPPARASSPPVSPAAGEIPDEE